MGLLGKLFGTDTGIDTAAKGIYNGVDKMFHTPEEKAEHFLNLLKAYEPFKLAQRLLALTVVGSYVFVWLLCVWLFGVGAVFDSETHLLAAKELGAMNNDTLGLPTGLILGFYFGGGAVEGVVNRFRKKPETGN